MRIFVSENVYKVFFWFQLERFIRDDFLFSKERKTVGFHRSRRHYFYF